MLTYAFFFFEVDLRTFLTMFILLTVACDPQHKKKCEWYLMPDTERIGEVDDGMIPVCARNFVTNKQDCRLQTNLKFAETVYNKKFRYDDVRVKAFGNPRTIEEIRLCE